MRKVQLRSAVGAAAVCLLVLLSPDSAPTAQQPPSHYVPPRAQSPGAADSRLSSSSEPREATATEIRKAVDDAIRERLRDSKVVELETSQAIASRLSEWAKLFGFFIGIPLALFVAWLGAVGFKSYKDVKSVIDSARKDVTKAFNKARQDATSAGDAANKTADEVRAILAKAQEDARKFQDEVQTFRAKLQEVGALVPQVQELSQKVATIENVVRFKASRSITPELKESINQTLQDYFGYLKSVGLSYKLRPPTVVVKGKVLNAYYEGMPKNQIVVHPDLIGQPYVVLREFTHHVLIEMKELKGGSDGGMDASVDNAGLESGLADYLPSSFAADPDFGKDTWPLFERHTPGLKVRSRNLANQLPFSEINHKRFSPQENGTVWGGAYWELRDALGREALDALLLVAWKSLNLADAEKDLKLFPIELVKHDAALNGGAHQKEIRDVFKRRGLKF